MTPVRRKQTIRCLVKRDCPDGPIVCCFCNDELSFRTATLDHIIPHSKGGLANLWNLAIACSRCNNERGDDDFFETLQFFHASDEKIAYYHKILSNYKYLAKIQLYISKIKSNKKWITGAAKNAALLTLGRLIRPLSLGHRMKMYGIGRRSWLS